ncbi:MAG: hypothetical protein JWP74_4018 [Marmoricola sp.]|nr:hypothetical protein [Marmoricola sp.]
MSSPSAEDRVLQTRMPAPQRQEQLLDACRRLVDVEGFVAVTVERVAGECGVTRPVIYQQFGSLSGMLTALVDREFARAATGFGTAMSPHGDQPGFAEAFRRLMAVVDADPSTWRMFMFPAAGAPSELYERLDQARSLTRDYLTVTLRQRGEGKVQDAELSARFVHAAADEAVRLRLSDPNRYSVDQLVSPLTQLVAAMMG